MDNRTQIISIVGPESTGKTTLAVALGRHFNVPVVPEFAREYLDRTNGLYEEKDLLVIAKEQAELENQFVSKADGPVFCDTDLLVIMVWQQFKYGRNNPELEKLFAAQPPRKYLLMFPDLAWSPDPLRENPNDLDLIFNFYETMLRMINADYSVIRGIGEERLDCALEAIG